MISLRGVWFRYPGSRRYSVAGVTLEFGAGVVGVVGPNGAGKTTLLKLASGLLRPERGEVLVGGRSLWRVGSGERLRLRRRVVYVHERPVMLRGSVLDNIAYGLRLRGVEPGEAEGRAVEAAEQLGLRSLLGEKARRLSRGLQQLVALARALVLQPDALLLDEPFAHLDPERRRLVAGVVAEYASHPGRLVAVASHDTLLLSKIASRFILLEEGRLRGAAGSLEELGYA